MGTKRANLSLFIIAAIIAGAGPVHADSSGALMRMSKAPADARSGFEGSVEREAVFLSADEAPAAEESVGGIPESPVFGITGPIGGDVPPPARRPEEPANASGPGSPSPAAGPLGPGIGPGALGLVGAAIEVGQDIAQAVADDDAGTLIGIGVGALVGALFAGVGGALAGAQIGAALAA